jgi:D-alanyl-D-alanine dipeptidase
MGLIEIDAASYGVEIALAYATAENFTGKPVYARAAAYLHPDAAACLRRAVDLATPLGLKLVLLDAYRPTEAQWKLWEHTPDPMFLADPRRGSPHSRGVAVDLTLVERGGRRLDMGTPFDDFTPRSWHADRSISAEAQRNRLLLLGIMSASGWDFYSKEWWHYQLFDARRYPLYSDSVLQRGLMAA